MTSQTETSAAFINAFCGHLSKLDAVLLAHRSASLANQPAEEAFVEQARALSVELHSLVGEAYAEHNPEKIALLDEAYRTALFSKEAGIRGALGWFFDNYTGHQVSVKEAPFTVTAGVGCAIRMVGRPGTGDFPDTAPVAAWVAERLQLPVAQVSVLAQPLNAYECRDGFSRIMHAVASCKIPELLTLSNDERRPFDPPSDAASEEVAFPHPMVLLVSLRLKDDAEVEQVFQRIAAQAHVAYNDVTLDLPYFIGTETAFAQVRPHYLNWPLTAFVTLSYAREEEAISAALTSLAERGYTPNQLRLSLRRAEPFDQVPICFFEIMSIDQDTLLFMGDGVPEQEAPFFLERVLQVFGNRGFGEIAFDKSWAGDDGADEPAEAVGH